MSERIERGRQLSPSDIPELLRQANTIAIVGASSSPSRESHGIGLMLKRNGYTVIPVNPVYDRVFDTPTYDSLEEATEKIDIVDVFRNARHATEVVRSAIAAGHKVIWFQLGTHTDEAVELALANGLTVVTDHCIGVEVSKLGSSSPDT